MYYASNVRSGLNSLVKIYLWEHWNSQQDYNIEVTYNKNINTRRVLYYTRIVVTDL
jgi:hypothetical protein